jgi:hypothetical protein
MFVPRAGPPNSLGYCPLVIASPWALGWDALVAIGTLSLAAGTYWLARTTKKVASADVANLRAQWRPMLVPTGDPIFEANRETGQWTGGIPIRNSGRGPALYVRATLEPPNYSPDPWSLGAISPGETRILQFSLPSRNLNYQLLLDYRDLAGRLYSSAIVIDFPSNDDTKPGRFYDVKLFEDITVTSLGDSVPQQGLSLVGPEPSKSLGQRLRDSFTGAVAGAVEGFRRESD